MSAVLPAAVAALTTTVLLWVLLHSRLSSAIRDVPNTRSLHAAPTPRIGGIGLMGGVAAGWMFESVAAAWWLLLPLVLLLGISLLDDIKGVGVRVRLAVQMSSAVLLVFGSGLLSVDGLLIVLFMSAFVVWMTNLYNFMDGSDGLAGGMTLFGFFAYGLVAMQTGNESLAILSFAVSAAAAGFLCFNFPPAKLFMGDAGSIPLGFLVAAIGMMGWQQGCWEPWFPLLVFSPFIMDASVTLIKRWVGGLRITEPHREHYYQRAVRLGYGHRKVALAEYALMVATGGSAIWASQHGSAGKVLLAWLVVYAVIMSLLDNRWKKLGQDS
jgi:UDP-N-acetylmuramyl pentapeptide phosphotransferase/UDP-N-acetylglucosamine-1-phosphate transferase